MLIGNSFILPRITCPMYVSSCFNVPKTYSSKGITLSCSNYCWRLGGLWSRCWTGFQNLMHPEILCCFVIQITAKTPSLLLIFTDCNLHLNITRHLNRQVHSFKTSSFLYVLPRLPIHPFNNFLSYSVVYASWFTVDSHNPGCLHLGEEVF